MLTDYLYRTCKNDEAGDPLDFGLIRATDMDDAREQLKVRFNELGLAPPDRNTFIYAGKPLAGRGILDTSLPVVLTA